MPLSDFLYTDGVDDVMAEHVNRLTASLLRGELGEAINITTQLALTDADFPSLKITPNAALDVLLPQEAATNHIHVIENGSGTYSLIIKDDSGTTAYVTLEPGDWALFLPSLGTAWKLISSSVFAKGWVPVSDSWTYASASTITVPSGAASKYQKGMAIRFKQGGGYKYYNIWSVADTLLTVFINTDYTVANSAITDIAVSYMNQPFGFPTTFSLAVPTWTTTGTAFTNQPGSNSHKYTIEGNQITIAGKATTNATSGGTGRFVATWSAGSIPAPDPYGFGGISLGLSAGIFGHCFVESAGNGIQMCKYDGTAIAANSQQFAFNIRYKF